jgi:hypothetical protein
LVEEFDERELFEFPDELELFELFELFELLEDFAVEPLELPVPVACVEPGSTTATAPAAMTLAKPTVAVAALSLRLPCSRSATARETRRAAPEARGDP